MLRYGLWMIVFFVLVSGCIVSDTSDTKGENLCDPPYMNFERACCLDRDDNKVCDSDEKQTTQISQTSMAPTSTSLNPTTSSQEKTTVTVTTSTMPSIACTMNKDCSGPINYTKCYRGDVVMYSETSTCRKPGTPEAQCIKKSNFKPFDECGDWETCVVGKCVNSSMVACNDSCMEKGYGLWYCHDSKTCDSGDIRSEIADGNCQADYCCCNTTAPAQLSAVTITNTTTTSTQIGTTSSLSTTSTQGSSTSSSTTSLTTAGVSTTILFRFPTTTGFLLPTTTFKVGYTITTTTVKSTTTTTVEQCRDTDDGIAPFDYGECISVLSGSIWYQDVCFSKTAVNEYYCHSSGACQSTRKECGAGAECNQGRCKLTTTTLPFCSDSDGDILTIVGECRDGNKRYTDRCEGDDRLIEYGCRQGELICSESPAYCSHSVGPNFRCRDGRCVEL